MRRPRLQLLCQRGSSSAARTPVGEDHGAGKWMGRKGEPWLATVATRGQGNWAVNLHGAPHQAAPSSFSLQSLITDQQRFRFRVEGEKEGWESRIQMALLASVGFIWSLCKSRSASQIAFEADA